MCHALITLFTVCVYPDSFMQQIVKFVFGCDDVLHLVCKFDSFEE